MIPDTTSPAASTIIPDGESLTVDSLLDIARDPTIQVELTPEIRKRVIASRKLLDEFVDSGRVIYGVTTSVGGFVNWLVPPVHAEETQNNIMRSVQTNVGAYLDDHYVRASMLARINSLGRGYSAISIENLDKYVAMFCPAFPRKVHLAPAVTSDRWRVLASSAQVSGARSSMVKSCPVQRQ
jgi:histidine ammonia-lyase